MTTTYRMRTATLAAAAALAAASAFAQPAAKVPPTGAMTPTYTLELDKEVGALHAFGDEYTFGKAMEPGKMTGGSAVLMMTAGIEAPHSLFAWASSPFNGKPAYASGAVAITAGAAAKAKEAKSSASIVTFENALVKEIDFPQLSAASRDPVLIGIKASAASVRSGPGMGAKPAPAKATKAAWLASGYRLVLGKLDCRGVDAIAAFKLVPGQPLTLRLHTRQPTTEALMKAASAGAAKPGLANPPVTKGTLLDGQLELQTVDGRTVLATIALHDVRIEAPAAAKAAPGAISKVAEAEIDVTAGRVGLVFSPALAK